MIRPDPRPSEVVWHHFEKAFENGGFPSVSWALGSDWGMGRGTVSEDGYRAMAYGRMEKIYGPKEQV